MAHYVASIYSSYEAVINVGYECRRCIELPSHKFDYKMKA